MSEDAELMDGLPRMQWWCIAPPWIDRACFDDEDNETWLAQSRYLDTYCHTRTRTTSARCAGVSIWQVDEWESGDVLAFNERKAYAENVFRDMLEDKLTEIVMSLKPGQSIVPLMNKLEVELPDKYGSGATHEDGSKEVLRRLTLFALGGQQVVEARNGR